MSELNFAAHIQTLTPQQQLEYVEGIRASALEAFNLVHNEEGTLKDALPQAKSVCEGMFGARGLALTDLSMRGSKLAVALSDEPGSYVSISHINEEFIYTFSVDNKTVSVFRERELG